MKILDYNPGFGTLSAGLEMIHDVEVSEVVKLSKNAQYGYNSVHKQYFPTSIETIPTFQPQDDVDIAIFNPEFGENIGRKAKDNFFFTDFQNCLDFLASQKPKIAIFQTEIDVVPLINTAPEYIRDGFNQVSKDLMIYKLSKLGYKPYLFVVDEAEYGIPIHRSFAFYIAIPKTMDFMAPKSYFAPRKTGRFEKYRTVADAISDLDKTGDWVEYSGEPKNAYQKLLRNTNPQMVTWNSVQNIKESTKEKISSIKQGSNNDTIVAKSRSKGYNRAKWDDICRCMDDKFYLVSSKLGDSIHPIKNRPFTIREGCRIHGLPDRLSFELSVPVRETAKLVHNSVSPFIGMLVGLGLKLDLD